jgi:hypothetical protein
MRSEKGNLNVIALYCVMDDDDSEEAKCSRLNINIRHRSSEIQISLQILAL